MCDRQKEKKEKDFNQKNEHDEACAFTIFDKS